MIEIRTFDQLGRFDNDWLSARYHFSFANYHDPARMGFGPLLVWNDDTIQPGRGFDRHGRPGQRQPARPSPPHPRSSRRPLSNRRDSATAKAPARPPGSTR